MGNASLRIKQVENFKDLKKISKLLYLKLKQEQKRNDSDRNGLKLKLCGNYLLTGKSSQLKLLLT